jgi:hypothetical protein
MDSTLRATTLPTVSSNKSVLTQMSIYSHVIVVISVLMLSAYAVSVDKGLMYLLWLCVASGLRMGLLYARFRNSDSDKNKTFEESQNNTCSSGSYLSATFSTFVMSFTAMYFLMPMFMAGGSQINFGLLLMFFAAIVYDGCIKTSSACVSDDEHSRKEMVKAFAGDTVGGAGLGAAITAIVFHSGIKGTLFLHDVNTDGETCSVPTQQQFKCRMYKNGQLVQ